MKYILMSFPIAVKRGIVVKNTDRLHNDKIVLLEEQDLVSLGYNIQSLPKEFKAEVLCAREMKLKITDLGL